MLMIQKAAIYLDRDGVIIENRSDYVRDWSQVEIYPQALKALALMSALPYLVVLVTNQSAIGRGIIPLSTAKDINHRLLQVIQAHGGRVDGVYLCPHAPQDDCSCRKPAPGLLLQAAEELNIDLGHSYMVGDALSDLQAGASAGVANHILLMTGRGQQQHKLLQDSPVQPTQVYPDLLAFAQSLTQTQNRADRVFISTE